MRRGLLGVVAAGVVAALAGCGSSASNASVSIETLQAAAENTQSAESYRFELEETIRSNGKTVTITGTGTSSADGQASTAKLEIPEIGTIEYRLIGKVMYIDGSQFPAFSSELPAGKRWLKIDLGALSGLDLDQFYDQAKSSSPSQGLKFLEALSGEPENLGDEQVNGARATHYRGTIDYGKLGDSVKDENVRRQIAKLGPVPVDVWIDDSDHIVKLHMKLVASAFSGQEEDGSVEVTMTIADIDEPVVVEAPSEDEVVDFADVFGARPGVI